MGLIWSSSVLAETPSAMPDWIGAIGQVSALAITGYTSDKLAFSQQMIHRIKAMDPKTGKPTAICLDANGALLIDDGDALRLAERKARFLQRGAIDDKLWEKLALSQNNGAISVGFWLRTDNGLPTPKNLLLVSPGKMAQAEDERKAFVAQAQAQFAADLLKETGKKAHLPLGAPVAYAKLTPLEIIAMSNQVSVGSMTLHSEPKPACASPTGLSYPSTDKATSAQSGFTGAGIKVCVIETFAPTSTCNAVFHAATYCTETGTDSPHTCLVAGIIHSNANPYGTAVGAEVYIAAAFCDNNETGSSAEGAYAWCADNSMTVWNNSWEFDGLNAALLDYWVKQPPYPSIAIPSGNIGEDPSTQESEKQCCEDGCTDSREEVSSRSFNALVVGGSNDCDDATRSNDTISCIGKDLNLADGREQPAIVAPAQWLKINGDLGVVHSGTSFASPEVAGAFAQMQEANYELQSWPEGGRAILMTTANRIVVAGEDFHACVNGSGDCQSGAGEVNVTAATALADLSHKVNHTDASWDAHVGGFDYDTLCDPTQSSGCGTWNTVGAGNFINSVYYAHSASATNKLRVSLVWDSTADCSNLYDPPNTGCSTDDLDADLDLYVFDNATNALVASSVSAVNPLEFVTFTNDPAKTYKIMVFIYHWTSSFTYYGLSWHTMAMD